MGHSGNVLALPSAETRCWKLVDWTDGRRRGSLICRAFVNWPADRQAAAGWCVVMPEQRTVCSPEQGGGGPELSVASPPVHAEIQLRAWPAHENLRRACRWSGRAWREELRYWALMRDELMRALCSGLLHWLSGKPPRLGGAGEHTNWRTGSCGLVDWRPRPR
ncbi:hypothetical protein NDU88_003468 [Pleurodeles waltl]|uniref:Uncharacterized protein n=1 Tax=Pleurodeles waltl TaxID=8319 RepID=A0AAV7SFD7_PLEWA|nr:hypothetical protein NDU88_003468 [Pleurodeles waltl]